MCPRGHGGFLPGAAPADRSPPPRVERVDEPECPSCGMLMDPILVDDGDALVASCQRCRGVWVGVGDSRIVGELLASLR